MLSTKYRLRMEYICRRIALKEEVKLEDMIWAEKVAKANQSAAGMLRRARREASMEMKEGGLDDFMNRMDIGDPDPSNHRDGFNSVDEIVDWFRRDPPEDWRTRD